jgi:hypothetical protein
VTIAGSIILIVVGAILRFAVTWTASGIDIHVVGDILMAGGAAGLIITLILMYTRRSRGAAPGEPPAEVYEERRYTDRYQDRPY